MSKPIGRAVAFHHEDGLAAAWNFAQRYAGDSGHIATLPEIVTMRVGDRYTSRDSSWSNWYTTSSAEYVGVGADGRIKIIVAHGVGPMSTIDGIKAAYKWQWADKTRHRNGGRITAQEFLDLESGRYGAVKNVHPYDFFGKNGNFVRQIQEASVYVIDFGVYLMSLNREDMSDYLTAPEALRDPLMRMRLGRNGYLYLKKHERLAREFYRKERPNARYRWGQEYDDREHPYITQVHTASNCSYLQRNEEIWKAHRKWVYDPRVPEQGYALAHLLSIEAFTYLHAGSPAGVMLASSPWVHEWWNGAKFVAVQDDVKSSDRIVAGPDPYDAIDTHWRHFMQPVEEVSAPVTPFLLKRVEDEWFTSYPKESPESQCMDDGNLEFHVRSVEPIGEDAKFFSDDDFFLRYSISQVRAIMPRGANSYEILDVSPKDKDGLTTVTVQFYKADVDMAQRLPRPKEIARNYERLMEVFTL